MKKRFKTVDYTFIIVAVLTIIILVAGVFSIDYVLNRPPKTDLEDETISPTENVYEDQINLLDENDYFRKYYISVQDTSYSADIEELTIDVSEDAVNINGVELISGGYPTKYISFYDKYLLVPFIYTDSWYGGILVYDTETGDNEIINEIADKYIVNDMESFTSSKDGIMLNISIVNEDKIYIDGKEEDICSIKKSKKLRVSENVFLKYDNKKKRIVFDKYERIGSVNLESYRLTNELCN